MDSRVESSSKGDGFHPALSLKRTSLGKAPLAQREVLVALQMHPLLCG